MLRVISSPTVVKAANTAMAPATSRARSRSSWVRRKASTRPPATHSVPTYQRSLVDIPAPPRRGDDRFFQLAYPELIRPGYVLIDPFELAPPRVPLRRQSNPLLSAARWSRGRGVFLPIPPLLPPAPHERLIAKGPPRRGVRSAHEGHTTRPGGSRRIPPWLPRTWPCCGSPTPDRCCSPRWSGACPTPPGRSA